MLLQFQLFLQSDYLVTILCSLQEVELFGSGLHQACSLLDALLQLWAGHALNNGVSGKGCFRGPDVGGSGQGRVVLVVARELT